MESSSNFSGRFLKIILVIFVSSLALCNGRSVSRKEYREMKRLLQSLNKPAVKSIQTEIGDIFDCVDMYKQPAFDHPLLKNHTIEMKPSSMPKETTGNGGAFRNKVTEIGLPDGGCPDGSVPIRRVRMEDLLRADSLSSFGKKHFFNTSTYKDKPEYKITIPFDYEVAEVTTLPGIFFGSRAIVNIWEPITYHSKQFSKSHLQLVAGIEKSSYADYNVIETGVMVFEEIFGDHHARLFGYWTRDSYKSGCFNILCPGFVQVSKIVALGGQFDHCSSYQGEQRETIFAIHRMEKSGNWWLNVQGEGVGYWPAALFTNIFSANMVSWGGEVGSSVVGVGMPTMGSGHFAEEGWRKASYMRNMQVVNQRNEYIDAPLNCYTISAKPCYTADDRGYNGDSRRQIYFGGPGGSCSQY